MGKAEPIGSPSGASSTPRCLLFLPPGSPCGAAGGGRTKEPGGQRKAASRLPEHGLRNFSYLSGQPEVIRHFVLASPHVPRGRLREAISATPIDPLGKA